MTEESSLVALEKSKQQLQQQSEDTRKRLRAVEEQIEQAEKKRQEERAQEFANHVPLLPNHSNILGRDNDDNWYLRLRRLKGVVGIACRVDVESPNGKALESNESSDESSSTEDKLFASIEEARGVLDYNFYSGYGGSSGPHFTCWTADRVYFPAVYDGREWIDSVPRNPCAEATRHVGGE